MRNTCIGVACAALVGCGGASARQPAATSTPPAPAKEAVVTFEDEVAFLKKYGPV
jgi:hypothetical protein